MAMTQVSVIFVLFPISGTSSYDFLQYYYNRTVARTLTAESTVVLIYILV